MTTATTARSGVGLTKGHAEAADDVQAAILAERERCADIAEGLAEKWEASAANTRRTRTTRFFGLGKPYTTIEAERDAKTLDSAAHGLRTVAKLIRENWVRR